MAQFRGTLQGNRGDASRLGTKSSGLRVTANGWNIGAVVTLDHRNGEDVIHVGLNAGSGYGNQRRTLGTFKIRGSQIIKTSRF